MRDSEGPLHCLTGCSYFDIRFLKVCFLNSQTWLFHLRVKSIASMTLIIWNVFFAIFQTLGIFCHENFFLVIISFVIAFCFYFFLGRLWFILHFLEMFKPIQDVPKKFIRSVMIICMSMLMSTSPFFLLLSNFFISNFSDCLQPIFIFKLFHVSVEQVVF